MIKLDYELKGGIKKFALTMLDVGSKEELLSLLSKMEGESISLGGNVSIKFHHKNRLYKMVSIRRDGESVKVKASEKIIDGGAVKYRYVEIDGHENTHVLMALRSLVTAFNASLLAEKFRNGTCTEWCQSCQSEVTIKRSFTKKQVCPSCGASIKPCNLCDMDKIDCRYCPLD